MTIRPMVSGQLDKADFPRQKPDALDQNREKRSRRELFPLAIAINSGSQRLWRALMLI